ncbi:MAG: transcriptional coactivator p15/PC4 family protein, partial [Candidatus Gastranaerophilaceae bacterium]
EEDMADAKILATIERSDTEQLQISVSEYKGRSYLNMRIFYTTDEGATWLPTKKGVTFAPEQLDLLEEAIQEAKKEFMADAE